MDADERFWAEPNSFLIHDSPYGAHFILYNFKSMMPFSAGELSELKVAGVLRYKASKVIVEPNPHHLSLASIVGCSTFEACIQA